MYTSPVLRRMREAVDDAAGDAEFTARLVDAITNDEAVRTAILRLTRARQAPAAAKTPTRGRSR
jgi:hypothetical protein